MQHFATDRLREPVRRRLLVRDPKSCSLLLSTQNLGKIAGSSARHVVMERPGSMV
jgi:hypothetical protein